jgi:hypothetical protein
MGALRLVWNVAVVHLAGALDTAAAIDESSITFFSQSFAGFRIDQMYRATRQAGDGFVGVLSPRRFIDLGPASPVSSFS